MIAGRDFIAGQTGHGGTLNGGVQYGRTADVADVFKVNGGLVHADPPFDFGFEFQSLTSLSTAWGMLPQTAGATAVLDPNSKALQLTGKDAGLNVFQVTAADLTAAAGIVIDLTQSGATALINITTNQAVTVAPQYMNLSGTATNAQVVWNLPNTTSFSVNHGVGWHGLILAPNATVTSSQHPQLSGEIIANTMPTSDWVLNLRRVRRMRAGAQREAHDLVPGIQPRSARRPGRGDLRYRHPEGWPDADRDGAIRPLSPRRRELHRRSAVHLDLDGDRRRAVHVRRLHAQHGGYVSLAGLVFG